MKEPRRIKPNPKDPGWTFSYASRARILKLEKQFASYKPGSNNFFKKPHTRILPQNRPNPIPWESVPPQYRHRCQQLFNRRIAEERAKGIPGWPTRGKINSIRMCCTNAGRHMFNGEYYTRYQIYMKQRKMWMLYLEWLAEQRYLEELRARGAAESKVLEVA